jgi:hypothetical protein
MSDVPQGPDWWQASDDKWYPPPRPEMPGDAASPVATPTTAPPTGPPYAPPPGPPSGGFAPPGAGMPGPGGFPPGPPAGPPSPYGGMPPAAPSPGSQNRTPLYVAIGVVVAAALVGLIVVLSGGDDDEPAASTTTTDPTATTAEPSDTTEPPGTTEADGGGEPAGDATVEVVEQGFSNFMGGFDGDEPSASYGFIVENTGDTVATDISISISAYDAAGTAVASDSETIYVLRPGEKIGIGDEFYGTTLTGPIDRVDVQVSEPANYSVGEVPDEGTLTAEGITTTADDYGVNTTFTATSTYAEQIDSPNAYAIYRDAAGKIIGGSLGFLDFVPANGSVAAEVSSYELIPNIASTEVYPDPGYFG